MRKGRARRKGTGIRWLYAFFRIALLMAAAYLGTAAGELVADGTEHADALRTFSERAPDVQEDKALYIRMLNAGQGDAILIQTKKQNILVDASDADERKKLRSELNKFEIRRIDKLILTHPHADHIGGAEMLLRDYDVREIYDNGMPSASMLHLGYLRLAKSKGIPRHALQAGDALDLGCGVSLSVLYPPPALVREGQQKDYAHHPNNESVVMRLAYGDFSMLFTGDAEREAEQALLGASLKSDVLKAPHHGSKSSSSLAFVQAVAPEAVLISAGEPDVKGGNEYGHPHKDALKSYQKAGVKNDRIYWTYPNGTITIETDGKDYRITPEQEKEWVTEWLKK